MKTIRIFSSALAAVIFNVSVIQSSWADTEQSGPSRSLAGRMFAVQAEILSTLDPSFYVGQVFTNCYIFHEDGTWEDPLFPTLDPANDPVMGTWVQHSELPSTTYTAVVTGTFPAVLIQNGSVIPARGNAGQRLVAYTTAFLHEGKIGADGNPAPLALVEVESRGHAVDECPELEALPIP